MVWPVRGEPRGAGWAGSLTFHNRTVPSALPLARMRASVLNTTEETVLVWPVRGGAQGAGWAGSLTFHNRTVSSALPLARVRPSGLNTTALTESV